MDMLGRIEDLARSFRSIVEISLLALVILIGIADYLTGNELSFSIFYLLPISLASWFVGKKMGVFISVASFTALLCADLLAGSRYSHTAIPYWNGVVRLGFFVIVVLILSELKREYSKELELNAELQDALKRLEQKQEELKQKAEDLARSNAELEKFAYVAAHDLRGPLIGIGGYVQHLRRRLKDKLDPDAERVLEQILGQVVRMENLIHALLGYARVGTARLEVKRVDFNEIIHQVIVDLQTEIEKSEALVTSDPLPTIWADGTQIRQLLQNLISNGIKFRGQEPPRVHLSARKGGIDFIFSVKDNGIGIDSKDQTRIFDMFQRLHDNSKYPGSGIGLAISKKIVENHGGRIWVESEFQKGTIFYFTIPVKEPSESAQGQ
jgi:light-regulated signal transduction histidine kinase (bacteriophytochrome)